jgi:hypothetical protein
MSSPLISAKALSTNPEAQQLHEAGLEAELGGYYTQAHEQFDAARQVLAELPQTLDSIVQSARITRDSGFTYVRTAIYENKPFVLERARITIKRSVERTAPLISETEQIQPNSISKDAKREFLAEHGATVSLLGRIATVKEVMLGNDTRDDSEAARYARDVEQEPYGLAHDILRHGNNGYYRVSNAMVGARQERINGRLPQMSVWLGRAATGLAWTALYDSSNLKAAVRTIGNRTRHLRSYRAAIASVTAQP